MTTQQQKCRFAQLLERFELFGFTIRFAFVDDIDEIVGQHEWHTLTTDAEFFLKVAKNVTEIDVEQL